MAMIAVDTNIVVRLLTKDDPAQFQRIFLTDLSLRNCFNGSMYCFKFSAQL